MTETTRRLVERLFEEMMSRDVEKFVDALADDVVFETPFPVPGIPGRMVGREQVRAHLNQRWARTSDLRIHGIHAEVTETTDPDLVFVENDVDLTPPHGERIRVRTSVNVVRARDGKIVLFRDYMSGSRVAELTDDAAGRVAGPPAAGSLP
jgi:ketosteroid isomerase-like protein